MRSSQARIDLAAHEFGDRRLTLNNAEVNIIRYCRKTDDDPTLAINLNAAVAQPVEVVVAHANLSPLQTRLASSPGTHVSRSKRRSNAIASISVNAST